MKLLCVEINTLYINSSKSKSLLGFPLYPEVMAVPPRSARPSNRASGMYGGRPEYYQGRPYQGFFNGR